MTKVVLQCRDNTLTFRAWDHAERSNDEDVNLCCAGISMLVQTAAEYANRLVEKREGNELELVLHSGYSEIRVKAHDVYRYSLYGVHDFIKAGIDLLMEKYPDRITWGEM